MEHFLVCVFSETEGRYIVSLCGVMLLVAPIFAAVENAFEITENTFGKSLHS